MSGSGRSGDAAVSFPPRMTPGTRVVVLGSMPGRRSLAMGQYYGHPRNRLWPVLADLLGFDSAAEYESRMAAALEAGLGFWDVLRSCERPGSLDGAIRRDTEIPNDLAGLLATHPGIRALAFNGRKAADAFARHVRPVVPEERLERVRLLELPSTSPANATVSYDALRDRWSVVAEVLAA